MEKLLQDLRFGARMLTKHRGITAATVLALALGIGLTTTVFSILDGAFLRGLPFEDQEQLMHIERSRLSEGVETMGVPIHDFGDWREQQASFQDLAAFYRSSVNVSGTEGPPARYRGAYVTDSTFDLLRARPALGRGFRAGEDQPNAQPVVVIGHTLWRDRFGRRASVLGQTLRANGQTMTIVGVMPEGFRFPSFADIWIPLRMDPLTLPRGRGRTLNVLGRLKDGVSQDRASAELAAIARRLEQEHPETNQGIGAVVQPFIHKFMPYEQRAGMVTMLAAVFGVLLIACVNTANLLLARTAARSQEIAVRSALGAGRARLIRQLLTEAGVLAAAGALLGLGVARLGIGLFNRAIVDNPPPFWMEFRIDPTAVGFVLSLTVLATLLSGVAPALRASGAQTNLALKDESRSLSSLSLGRFSRGLVVAEVALSCGLLLVASLMIMSIAKLDRRTFAFSTDDVFHAGVALVESDYPDEESRRRFFDTLKPRLEGKPGVQSVALVSHLPGLRASAARLEVEGTAQVSSESRPRTRWAAVTPRSFQTFGVGVLEGRDFLPSDREGSPPVAIVNRSFVERFLPGTDPIGRRIKLALSDEELPWTTVVGVVPDLMTTGSLLEERAEGVYLPLDQRPPRFVNIAIRARGEPLALTAMVREQVTAMDPDLPIYGVSTLKRTIAGRTWFVGVFGGLFVVFGFAALVLAAVGLYGVVAFNVRRRWREFGLRMTLGAEPGDVRNLVLRQGASQLGTGLLVGLVLGIGLARLVEGFLYGLDPWDPVALAAVLGSTIAVGVAACLIPARGATRLSPAAAMRHE